MKMEIKYNNEKLLIIKDEIKKTYSIGDEITISLKTSYYGDYKGKISDIIDGKIELKDLNASSMYTVGFDFIKDII